MQSRKANSAIDLKTRVNARRRVSTRAAYMADLADMADVIGGLVWIAAPWIALFVLVQSGADGEDPAAMLSGLALMTWGLVGAPLTSDAPGYLARFLFLK